MKNLKVSMKLIVSFMIVVLMAVVIGGVGIFGMSYISSAGEALYSENVVAIGAMGDIREILQNQIVQIRNIAINSGNSAKIQEYQTILSGLERDMETHMLEYEDCITAESEESAYYEAKNLYFNDFSESKRRVIEASYINAEAAYDVLYDQKVATVRDRMVSNFDASMVHNSNVARETVTGNVNLFKSMMIVEICVLVAVIIIAIFLAFYLSSLISKPLLLLAAFMEKAGSTGDLALSQEDISVIGMYSQINDEIGRSIAGCASFVQHVTHIADELDTIAEGNLTGDIKPLSDLDRMGKSLKVMVDNLNNMFGEIQASTNQVSTGAKQVADGAQSLAQGSTEQAASIEELSSSITEIAEKTKTNAGTAEITSKLSASIKESAEKGSRQMDEMITAVKDINDASNSISKIIKTIDDIAFQTNILALNAAVEAARAGQHGKGFAVVAEEVRNLASKSAEAAKDTGNMIQDSMEKAGLGARIAGETASSLSEIVIGINESSKLVAEIAIASEQQSQGISQINIGIDQVAQVIQQNSATAEESAAASEEMSGQSDMLQQLIAQFKLKKKSESMYRGSGAYYEGKPAQARIAIPEKLAYEDAGAGGVAGGDFGKY
ncbi:MAG: methyl-accepting chemotaxis protein [Oscillospiraceae bacterium]|nr:methyl-accepting chemotaxis protein [Oscillospiraceae bacterium]